MEIADWRFENLTDVNVMRQEAQNERQLRGALKLYWPTQKEDAARAAQPDGESHEADELLEALEQSLDSTVFDTKQSQQVIENTEEVSGIGQNKAKSGNREKGKPGEEGNGEEPFLPWPLCPFPPRANFSWHQLKPAACLSLPWVCSFSS